MAIGKGFAAIVGCLAALTLPGCHSCGNYTINSEMGKALSENGTHAIPIYVYFVKAGGDGINIAEWYKNPMGFGTQIDSSMLVSTKAVGGIPYKLPTRQLQAKAEKVCIWAGNPNPADAAGHSPEAFHRTVEASKIQGCTFDILVTGEGLSVKSNNVEVTQMEGVP